MGIERLLNSTCTIQDKTQSQNSLGEMAETWADEATGVPCRFVRAQQPSVDTAFGRTAVLEDRFFFTADVVIDESKRIVHNTKTYEVTFVREDSEGHHQTVSVKEVFHD